tara:strand:+ start:674 stop:1075 length:402 start_codon:yes stop_codon:yes gene_type:complete
MNDRELSPAGSLDVLGFYISTTAQVYSFIHKVSIGDALENLKDIRLTFGFGRYRSVHENTFLRDEGGVNNGFRNFTLFFEIDDPQLSVRPPHFNWEGSYEGLETKMNAEVAILQELGYTVDYKGYMPEHDVLI